MPYGRDMPVVAVPSPLIAEEPSHRPVVIDLCSGMGGLSQAGRELGLRIIAGVDTNAQALKTFTANFDGAETIEGKVGGTRVIAACSDVLARLRSGQAPLVIVSGPPCQGFSPAGSRKVNDKRNKVLLAVGRTIVALKPDCALIENVATVLTPKHAARVRDLERTLRGGGYNVVPVSLNACDYGVAQRRERAFFLISRSKLDVACVQEKLDAAKVAEISVETALNGLPDAPQRPLDYDDEADGGDLPNHYAMRHSAAVTAKIAAIAPGSGPMSYRKLHPQRQANTLFSGHRAPPAHFRYPRSITVREAARLQGFPNTFCVRGSFSNQMQQVTNAVPPPMAKAVLHILLELSGLIKIQHNVGQTSALTQQIRQFSAAAKAV